MTNFKIRTVLFLQYLKKLQLCEYIIGTFLLLRRTNVIDEYLLFLN